jgi:hypothetical protein
MPEKVQDQIPSVGDEQQAWIDACAQEQRERHAQIVADMEAMSQQRDEWIEGFIERIQTMGFNYNCDAKRLIPEDEVPQRPDRPFKVVF